ncbi:hypothetical protein CEXT_592041 [Caerostris extrusa]|uniref:Uncharacterized protein n=1 Tax=Caerostris extrusa TaxID=172846 RepID=A0AAV4YC40_CAEEX|nr:hypothetical protein CEXT_592041 [Caerostris extrusa]
MYKKVLIYIHLFDKDFIHKIMKAIELFTKLHLFDRFAEHGQGIPRRTQPTNSPNLDVYREVRGNYGREEKATSALFDQ